MAQEQPGSRSRATRLIAAAIVIAVILTFALQNRGRTPIHFLSFRRDSRLIYIIIGSAILGAIADRLLLVRRRRRQRD